MQAGARVFINIPCCARDGSVPGGTSVGDCSIEFIYELDSFLTGDLFSCILGFKLAGPAFATAGWITVCS